jgi:sporulation protein YlmC with PRC-barrel domain
MIDAAVQPVGAMFQSTSLATSQGNRPMEPNVQSARIVDGVNNVETVSQKLFPETDGPGPRLMSADSLEGNDVTNAAGDDLGSIEHIMLDVPSGKIAYAVLSFGGMMGMGGKLFAVPWRALKLDTQEKCFVMETSKERLESAPGFDKDKWPSMADQQWARDIHTYYDSAPYWE